MEAEVDSIFITPTTEYLLVTVKQADNSVSYRVKIPPHEYFYIALSFLQAGLSYSRKVHLFD